jgi:PTS system beta-glucosides-specific IIC component
MTGIKVRKNLVSAAIETLSGIFLPIVNLLSAAGILKGIVIALSTAGVLSPADTTYTFLYAMGDGLFYFLPVVLAATAAKKFGANVYTALVIGGILLYPSLTDLFEAGRTLSLAGVPLIPVRYPYSVIPIIFAAALQSFLEKGCGKVFPALVKEFLTPLFTTVITVSAVFFVLGPAGKLIGDALAAGYSAVYTMSRIAAGFFVGGLIQVMVIFGFHWGLIPIAMNNIAVNGSDTLLAFFAPPVFAQAGAAFGVFCKTKNRALKTSALSAVVSALFGITEPALFGVTMPLKKPFIAVCIAGALGGALAAYSRAAAMAFAFPSMLTMPVFIGNGFGLLLFSCLFSLLLAFILTLVFKFDAGV